MSDDKSMHEQFTEGRIHNFEEFFEDERERPRGTGEDIFRNEGFRMIKRRRYLDSERPTE